MLVAALARILSAFVTDDLYGTRFGWILADHSRLDETGQVAVHGRGGGEPEGLADLPYRRRVAPLVHRRFEVVEDLLLSNAELGLTV